MTNNKRTVSPAKAAKIEESRKRKEALREVAKGSAALTEEQRLELAKNVFVNSVGGKSLSVNNKLLLMSQSKTATIVGGFNQWREAGRSVKKGEKALYIWCPARATKDAKGNVIDPSDPRSLFFVLGAVFDIAQTQEADVANAEAEEAEAA